MMNRSDNPILKRPSPALPTHRDVDFDDIQPPDDPDDEPGNDQATRAAARDRRERAEAARGAYWLDASDAWEQVAEADDDTYVLIHDGKLYAATPIDVADTVHRAFNRA